MTVVSDDAPVYSRASATGAVAAILQKGQIVTLQPGASAGSDCWLNIAWGALHTGFIRCEDIQQPGPPVSSVATVIPVRQLDQIDQLLRLAGIDRYLQTITDKSSFRFLFNTQRLDENDAQVQKAFERVLRSSTLYDTVHASFSPYSSDERIGWLNEQLNQPLVHRVTEIVARTNAAESKHAFVPYLTGVVTTPASISRVRLVERIDKALNEPEASTEVAVALARFAATAQMKKFPSQQLDPRKLDEIFENLRAKELKKRMPAVRIATLYIFAPLTDEELDSYAQFLESDNVKWMHRVMLEGILKGGEALASDLVDELAPLTRPASRFLQDPAEGRTAQDLYAQGVRLIDGGKDLEAIRFLDAAIQLKPDYAIAYYKRGNAYRNMNSASQALSDYTQAIHFDPSMTLAYLNRGIANRYLDQPQRALEDLTLGIQSNLQVSALWIERAITYEKLKQYTQAIADYTQAIRITPSDGEPWAWRGMSHADLNEWQRSWQDCEIGIRLGTRRSELAGAYTCAGRALAQMQDYKRAIPELNRAVELDPESESAAITYQHRGWALEKTGQIDAALRDYDKAIQLDPRDAWPHCERFKVLDRLGRSAEGQKDRTYCSPEPK